MPLAEGSTFAGFTIVRQLGSGGMGEVYLARHPRLPRQDALKVLRADVSADGEYRARFNREADAAASLWHPHIVAVHDRGEFDGQLWIDMDFVDGTDTVSLLRDRYPNGMPGPEVTEIITAVAEALDYAHERRLLHRDVKPANILIANPDSPDRRIMLADFGIAGWVDDPSGLTATNMTVGTVSYAAPEQLMGNELDGRADQYALAATAFHLLTGSPPFQHANPAVVISQHLSASPPAIGDRVPELTPLDPVFAKALAKQPKDRYQRCVDFARALGHRLGGAGDVELRVLNDGVFVGSSVAPTTIDIFNEPICPPCGSFIRSYASDIDTAVADKQLAVRYHLLNFLDDQSHSKNYSTRAVAASYCVAGQNDPKLYASFYSALFGSDFQPQENAASDRTDAELAHLAQTVGAEPTAISCIKSGADLGTAQTKATNASETLAGFNASGTPFVWDGSMVVNYQDPSWLARLIG